MRWRQLALKSGVIRQISVVAGGGWRHRNGGWRRHRGNGAYRHRQLAYIAWRQCAAGSWPAAAAVAATLRNGNHHQRRGTHGWRLRPHRGWLRRSISGTA